MLIAQKSKRLTLTPVERTIAFHTHLRSVLERELCPAEGEHVRVGQAPRERYHLRGGRGQDLEKLPYDGGLPARRHLADEARVIGQEAHPAGRQEREPEKEAKVERSIDRRECSCNRFAPREAFSPVIMHIPPM